jgi:hypothetical protein
MTDRLAANKGQNISPSEGHLHWSEESTPLEAKTKLKALADLAQSIFTDYRTSTRGIKTSTGSLSDILEGSSYNFGAHGEHPQTDDSYPPDAQPEENCAVGEGRGFSRGGRGVSRGAGQGRSGGRTYDRFTRHPESRIPGQGRGRPRAGPHNLGPVALGSAFPVTDTHLPPPPKVRSADWGNMKGRNGQILTCYNCDVEGHIASQCDRPAKAALRNVTESTAMGYVSRILGIDDGLVPQEFPPFETWGPHITLLEDAVETHYVAKAAEKLAVARAAEECMIARDAEVKLRDSQT